MQNESTAMTSDAGCQTSQFDVVHFKAPDDAVANALPDSDCALERSSAIKGGMIAAHYPYQMGIQPWAEGFFADLVSYCTDQPVLYIRPLEKEFSQQMDCLHDKVQAVAASQMQAAGEQEQAGMFVPGVPCLARYSEDGLFYRAIIEKVDDVQDAVHVLHVDYLSEDILPKRDICECPPELRLNPLSYACVRLAGVQPNATRPIAEVYGRLLELLADASFYVRVIQCPDVEEGTNLPEVELYTAMDCQKLAYQTLIDEQYLVADTNQ
ncbi:tudor domain-containing protein 1-like [Anopheles arabiensis]|uniref:tudor domain-containing protein 1-like n=1 Tax=Anopheles arabiensis TaxID=7173 RepID=UPI001AADFEB5|nr:tudor domain-containing protein 1-like [Anopheles arabiensis]